MYVKRSIALSLEDNLENDLILIVVGARQVGKTTLLKQVYSEIKEKEQAYFINLENPEFLKLTNQHPDNIFKITNSIASEKQYVFIDEIQYLDNPTNFLKYIFDEYKGKVKLIVSGSSSFYLDKKFRDSLMGRKRVFYLFQFDFREFLESKNEEDLIKEFERSGNFSLINKKRIEQCFSEYITYGGYPAVVLGESYKLKELLLSEIAYDFIKKDIYEANIHEQDKYYSILKIIANQVGQLLNSGEIANKLNISFNTVEKYLYVMQKSFQISLIDLSECTFYFLGLLEGYFQFF